MNDRTKNKYGIKAKCATTEISKLRFVLEIINQVIEILYVNLTCKQQPRQGQPLGRYTSSYGFWGTKNVP